jgi:hypothetical protein
LLALGVGAPAVAQEDPPVPEDPSTTEPDESGTSVETEPPGPVSTEAPVGKVETVGDEDDQDEAREPVADEEASETVAEQTESTTSEPERDRFRPSFELVSEGVSLNNLDLRPLNNETFIDIYDSDDRSALAYTRLAADLEYDVQDDTTFALGASHTGEWGADSLGAANAFGGIFYVTRLMVQWRPIDGDGFSFGGAVGRQPIRIGGAEHDFFLDDVIDGVTLDVGFGKAGKLRLVPIDFYAPGRPDDIPFAAALGYAGPDPGYGSVGFGGDTDTFRFGGIYENTELIDDLHFRLFGFYADIGGGFGEHTGADRVFHGSHGNFSDNDFNWMGGTRIGYDLDGDVFDLGVYGEYARSGGIDRKATQIGVRDVTANGNAFGAAVVPELDLSSVDLSFIAQFFMAEGGQYTGAEGLLYNYGFVSMKGDQIGGVNLDQGAGWHPSAYVGTLGVHYSPQDFVRKSGMMVLHGGAGVALMEMVELDLDIWWLRDTGASNLEGFDNLGEIADELPFGYTEADLIPQERLGKTLGMELDARLGYTPTSLLEFYLQGGMFLPGPYYEIEIPRTGGTARGAEDPVNFWSVVAGASLNF